MAKIFEVSDRHEATVTAFRVDSEYDADIIVHITDDKYRAEGDFRWFLVDSQYDATTKLFWASDVYSAGLKVFVTSDEYQAKWRHDHSLHGKL